MYALKCISLNDNSTSCDISPFLCCRKDKMSDRKAVIKNADMSEEMQQDAVDCATQALEKYNIEKVCNLPALLDICMTR